jgi:hypothetical protein
MGQIVTIQSLRESGVRAADLSAARQGWLKLDRQGECAALSLYGTETGRLLLGPLVNPVLVGAEPDGLLIQGTEILADDCYIQEWLIVQAEQSPAPPEMPLW